MSEPADVHGPVRTSPDQSGPFRTFPVTAFFLLATLLLHKDLLPRMSTHVPSDLGDPLLNAWILWWNAQHAPWSADYWNAPAFAPAPYALAMSETLLGLAWISTPLQWLGAAPLVAYNTLYVLSPLLNALAAYGLCLSVTNHRGASLVGAAYFAFAPYRAGQLGHLQTTATFYMPLALLALHRYWISRRWLWLLPFAVCVVLNGLVSAYQLLYFGMLFGFLMICAAVASRDWRRIGIATAAMSAAMAVLAPILLVYQRVHDHWGLRRSVNEMQEFTADLTSWLQASDRLAIPHWNEPFWKPEGDVYPGVAFVALVAIGTVVAWRRRALPPAAWWLMGLCVVTWIVAAVLMLGPEARAYGRTFWDPAPFGWLVGLPGFNSLRVPARLAIVQMLAGSILVAVAMAGALRDSSRRARLVAAVMAVAIMADGWFALPVVPVPVPFPRALTAELVVELPSHGWAEDVPAMYRGIFHRVPVVNGYSGYVPPHYVPLQRDLASRCFESLDALRRGRSLDVIVWVNQATDVDLITAAARMWPDAPRDFLPRAEVFHVPANRDRAQTAFDDPIDLRRYCRAERAATPVGR